MTDSYPEHLNPFAEDTKPKSKLRISSSFRELKRTLRQSFRIKKKGSDSAKKEETKEEVVLRQKDDSFRRGAPASVPNDQILWPRSRFRERLAKTVIYSRERDDLQGRNPFEEANENEKLTVGRRKAKKRAPLPPNKSQSSQDIGSENLNAPTASHWSLTSADTDYSIDDTDVDVKRNSMVNNFKEFNEGMSKFQDDTNNNIVSKEVESNGNVPDLVISCPSDKDEDEPEHSADEKTSEDVRQTEVFLYHEKKSLYIGDSSDELNENSTYTGTVSLYITGSQDNLDGCNDEVCDKNQSDINSNVQVVPKRRRNKPSKDELLGIEEIK